jgi:hypothetical protein
MAKSSMMKKCTSIAGRFDVLLDALVQGWAHHPTEEVQGFTRSQWMLLLGKNLLRITLAAARVTQKKR